MRGKEGDLFEPLQAGLVGQFVEEGLLRGLVVLHGHLQNRGALLHGVQQPQTRVD